MRARIRHQPNFFAGLLFAGFGLAFGLGATQYEIGTAAQMGPGYFPMVLGGLLVPFGLAVVVRSLTVDEEEAIDRASIKPFLLIIGSVILFGALLMPLGLIACSLLLVLASAFASHEFGWRYATVSAVVLIGFCYFIFIHALGLPIPVWPGGL